EMPSADDTAQLVEENARKIAHRIGVAQIVRKPFPYIFIDDLLTSELYSAVLKLLSPDRFVPVDEHGNNFRFDLALDDPDHVCNEDRAVLKAFRDINSRLQRLLIEKFSSDLRCLFDEYYAERLIAPRGGDLFDRIVIRAPQILRREA